MKVNPAWPFRSLDSPGYAIYCVVMIALWALAPEKPSHVFWIVFYSAMLLPFIWKHRNALEKGSGPDEL